MLAEKSLPWTWKVKRHDDEQMMLPQVCDHDEGLR